MGSLMAGWNSRFQDSKTAMYQRNKSLTRVEIDAYWKSKNKTQEEQFSSTKDSSQKNQEKICKESSGMLRKSGSYPPSLVISCNEELAENTDKNNCWWRRSNSAFLNEPPVTEMEGPSYKYASQYHVAGSGNQNSAN